MTNKLAKLEMMRGFAAVYVMADHLLHGFAPALGRWSKIMVAPFRFGQEAVMLFFLISGFVIFLSTEKQRPDFPTYLTRRWRRIYPIFLLALGVCALDIVAFKSKPFPWRDFWGNLCMLQDSAEAKPGVWFQTLDDNLPLWSLAYEWWFYLLFYPIWRFVPGNRQWLIAAFISLFGVVGYAWHPNQACIYFAFFILWWTGAEFARQYTAEGRVTFRFQRLHVAVLGGFVVLVTTLFLWAQHVRPWAIPSADARFRSYPILQIRDFCSCLFIVTAAFIWQKFRWKGFNSFFGVFLWVAPISYGIYCMHYAIGITGAFFSFLPIGKERLLIATVVSLAAAWIAEVPFQKLVNRWTRFLPNRTLQSCGQTAVNTTISRVSADP